MFDLYMNHNLLYIRHRYVSNTGAGESMDWLEKTSKIKILIQPH